MSLRTRPLEFGLLLVAAGCGVAYSDPEPARPPAPDAPSATTAPALSLEGAFARAEELHHRQTEVRRAVAQLPEHPGAERDEQVQPLRDRKEQMAVDLQRLESEMDRAASEGSDAASTLAAAVRHVRDAQLGEKLRYSRGTIQQWDVGSALTLERNIEHDLAELRDLLASAR